MYTLVTRSRHSLDGRRSYKRYLQVHSFHFHRLCHRWSLSIGSCRRQDRLFHEDRLHNMCPQPADTPPPLVHPLVPVPGSETQPLLPAGNGTGAQNPARRSAQRRRSSQHAPLHRQRAPPASPDALQPLYALGLPPHGRQPLRYFDPR